MYDEDYFRKIIGDKYNTSDYYDNFTYRINNNVYTNIEKKDSFAKEQKPQNINKIVNKQNEIIKQEINNLKNDYSKYYPEIFRVINPMIEFVVEKNKGNSITEDIIEVMAREVYNAIEDDVDVKMRDNYNVSPAGLTKPPMNNPTPIPPQKPPINNPKPPVPPQKPPINNPIKPLQPQHKPNNKNLFDLIKILLINYLIDRHV